jgi:hypothetical protein
MSATGDHVKWNRPDVVRSISHAFSHILNLGKIKDVKVEGGLFERGRGHMGGGKRE